MAEGKTVHIKRTNPKGLMPIHANDFLMNHNANEFFLTFYELEPLYFEKDEDWTTIDTVDSVAVTKIVMTPEAANTLLRVLTKNLAKYKENLERYKKDVEKIDLE